MSNEELIKALRYCCEDVVDCHDCPLFDECDSFEYPLLHAADALEAAEKRIAELEAQLPKDAVEVVHGYWNFSEVNGLSVRICSVCNKKFYIVRGWNYCPNCGAKMDGKEQSNG